MRDGRDAEDFFARHEPFYTGSNGFDDAGEIMAEPSRKARPGKHLHFPAANFPIHWVDRSSSDLYANLALPKLGLLYVVQP